MCDDRYSALSQRWQSLRLDTIMTRYYESRRICKSSGTAVMITVILHKITTNRTLKSQRSASRVHISIIQALSLYAVQSTNQGVPKYSFFEHEHQPKQKVIETGKINFLPQRASERQMPRCIKQELLLRSEDHEGSELCGISARERDGAASTCGDHRCARS